MSDDRIHVLPGGHVGADDGEPVADVVEIARCILAAAESGELRGIAYGAALGDGSVMYGAAYEPGRQWATHYAVTKGTQMVLDAGDEYAEAVE